MAVPEVRELLERSHRLGADRRNTNWAGGNASVKGSAGDPVTGRPVELLWVKGSGGDLGTLTEQGLSVLRLDRLRSLADVYPGVEREDEMVSAFDYCLHGKGGAPPSIDTAMHGLVSATHVDHLHPESGIALATAADGEALTKQCFGGRVAWVPWRRPGFQLGLDVAAIQQANPEVIGVGLELARVRGAFDGDHPRRRAVHRRAGPPRAVRRGARRVRAAGGARAAAARRRAVPGAPRPGLDRPPPGRPLQRRRGGPGLPVPLQAPSVGGAGDLLP